ncbi:MAG: sensor histidine kinase [Chloroflexaceae bacterium]|nr:sensor histidine kinase [Chloroflexaceae bacterium]
MHSIQSRLLLVSVITTVLSIVLIALLFLVLDDYRNRAFYSNLPHRVILAWQQQPVIEAEWPYLPGREAEGYIVAADNRILFRYGANGCAIGEAVTNCVSDAATIPVEGRTLTTASGPWHEFNQPMRDGLRVVARVRPELFGAIVGGVAEISLIVALAAVVGSIPIAALLALITTRPLSRRLARIAQASRAFAQGDLAARTHEHARDEIGQLGAQFDQMAETISSQVQELRQLAEQNSALTLTAEKSARAAERASLARDLHDTVAQHLFSLAMGTASLPTLISQQPEQAARQAHQLADIAAHAQDELRNVLTWLRPGALEGRGLIDMLHELIDSWRNQHGIVVETQLQLNQPLPLLLENVLYRVCQESLNNIARHAQASHVSISLNQNERTTMLELSDDGHGFDLSATSMGLGLVGMRERVRAVGGTLHIISASGQGTHLEVQLPLPVQPVNEESHEHLAAVS